MIREFDPFVPIIDVDVASFSDAIPNESLIRFKTAITAQQSGTGDPSPLNVRSITGWTGAVVTHMGANLIPSTLYQASANIVVLGQDNNSTRDISLKAGTYTITYAAESALGTLYYTTGGSNVSLGSTKSATVTFANDVTVRFWIYYSGGVDANDIENVRLNVGSSDLGYEAYDGDTYTADWSSHGTVYGGTADLLNGTGVETFAAVDLGTLTWAYKSGSTNVFQTTGLQSAIESPDSDSDVITSICDTFAASDYSSIGGTDAHFGVSSAGVLAIMDTSYDNDLEGFQAAMSGVMLVYPLAEPVDFTFDAVDVKTRDGWNNIWTNTGKVLELYYSIDISYFRRYFSMNSGYILLDGGNIDLTSTDPQLIDGSWDRTVTAMETGKPIWAYNTKYGTGKPLTPVPVFCWYLSATSIVIVGATLHIIVSDTDYCVVQDVASA